MLSAMNIVQRCCLTAATLLSIHAGARAAELGVLAPVIQDKAVLMRPAPGNAGPAPVVTRVRAGRLYEALRREAAAGTTAAVLALDELAMKTAGAPAGPTWLYLSQEDGGFARRGFWLQEGGATRWVDEAMVDLVVDAGSVDDGSFEEIFAHELGHVMLRRLLPGLPAGYSRTPHHSFSVTDQQTAFDEGWATHFQGLARLLTQNARLRAQDAGLEGKADTALWLSNLDRTMRIDGMRRNWFVYRQTAQPGVSAQAFDLSPAFDPARLKSAAQMLACEGVLSTFFYRQLATPDAAALEARYAPMFRALHAMSRESWTPRRRCCRCWRVPWRRWRPRMASASSPSWPRPAAARWSRLNWRPRARPASRRRWSAMARPSSACSNPCARASRRPSPTRKRSRSGWQATSSRRSGCWPRPRWRST